MRTINLMQRVKNFLLLFTFMFITANVLAQTAPSVQWKKSFGGTRHEFAQSVITTTDGGSLVAGYVASKDVDVIGFKGNVDVWLIKLDSNGTMEWQKCLGGTGAEYGYSIHPTSDGNYIVAGKAAENGGDVSGHHGGGNNDAWIVKVDGSGNIIWQNCFGGTGTEEANDIVEAKNGGYVFLGGTNSYDGDVSGVHKSPIDSNIGDIWLVKLSVAGKLLWQKCLGGTSSESADELVATKDGGFIISGRTRSIDGDVIKRHDSSDVWIIKTDSLGSIQWSKTYGGSRQEQDAEIVECIEGGYAFAATSGSNDKDVTVNKGLFDAWIVRLDDTGKILWEKSFGGSSGDGVYNITQTPDSGFVIGAYSESNDKDISKNRGLGDWWIFKVDKNGSMQWGKTFGTTTADRLFGIALAKDGYVLVGDMGADNGDLLHEHRGSTDWVVIKLSDTTVTTRISKKYSRELIKLYPSPTSGLVQIDLPQGYEKAQVEVYDMMGKLLEVNMTEQGTTRTIDLSRYANGTYTIQVIEGGQSSSYKVIKQQ